jgi:predicted molibdopterin-dependent oxidoreductase YjgC
MQTSGAHRVRGRLTTPLVRVDGLLRPTTWDVALDTVARGLAHARSQHGPDAVGMFACSKTTNELNYAAQKLMRGVVGTNNIDSCNRT